MSVAALVRFWGDALILHPALADPVRALAWEDALPSALDAARAGQTGRAVDGLLAVLGDPSTRRVLPTPRPAPAPPPLAVTTGEGIPILTVGRPDALSDPEAARAVRAAMVEMVRVGRGIVDLRSEASLPPALDDAFAALFTRLAPPPAEAFRVHMGLASEDRRATGQFGSTWWVRPVARETVPRVVFVVDVRTVLPSAALALRARGCGWVVADAPCRPSVVGATREAYALGDGVAALLRVGEVLGEREPDAVVSADPVTAAIALLRNPPSAHVRVDLPEAAAAIPPEEERPRRNGTIGVCRAWALVRRFHPYRSLSDAALEKALPEQARERDRSLALRKLLVGLSDGHALVRSLHDTDVIGPAAPPVRLRWIEGRAIVVGLLHPLMGALGVRIGDEALAVDGTPVAKRLALLEPYLSAGTSGARRLYALNRLLAGPVGSGAAVTVRGADGRVRELALPRDPALFDPPPPERGGLSVRPLSGGAAYLDLDRLTAASLPAALASVRSARAWLIDGRGRTNELAWALAGYLTPTDGLPLARFECPVVAASAVAAGGGLTRTVVERARRGPWRFAGKVVYLVDERTQSQSELTGLFLRACGAVCVGAPTAGAIGDVTDLFAAEGVRVSFSGQRIVGADGYAVQGVGLPLAQRVTETIAGVRAGRDEVLDAALRRVTGR